MTPKEELTQKRKQLEALQRQVADLEDQLCIDRDKLEKEKRKKLSADLKALNLVKDFDLTIKLTGTVGVIYDDGVERNPGDVKISVNAETTSSTLTEAQVRLIAQGMSIEANHSDYTLKARGKTVIVTCDESVPYFFSKEQAKALNKLLDQ